MSDEGRIDFPTERELRERQIVNIIGKVNAGNILSAREEKLYREFLAEQSDASPESPAPDASPSPPPATRPETLPPRKDTSAWAKFWGCTVRTVQRWATDAQPYDNPPAMAHIILAQKKAGRGPREKAQSVLRGSQPAPAQDPIGVHRPRHVPSDAAAIPQSPESSNDADAIDLYELRRQYSQRLRLASDLNAVADIDLWHKRLLETNKAIREQEIHALKLGVDEGEIIAREQFAPLVWAIAYWSLRGVDQDLKTLTPHLVNLAYPEEVQSVLDRFFIRKRIVEPFARATAQSGVKLPDWVVSAFREAVSDFCADGELAFDEYLKAHAPQHA